MAISTSMFDREGPFMISMLQSVTARSVTSSDKLAAVAGSGTGKQPTGSPGVLPPPTSAQYQRLRCCPTIWVRSFDAEYCRVWGCAGAEGRQNSDHNLAGVGRFSGDRGASWESLTWLWTSRVARFFL